MLPADEPGLMMLRERRQTEDPRSHNPIQVETEQLTHRDENSLN